MEVGTHHTRPFRVPPQMSLWHHLRPTAKKQQQNNVEHPHLHLIDHN